MYCHTVKKISEWSPVEIALICKYWYPKTGVVIL